MDEPQAKADNLMGNAPAAWFMSSFPQTTVYYGELYGVDTLQYYGNRLPWAGRIMLGVGRQAEFHPRVFRLFELIRPGLSLGKLTYPPVARQVKCQFIGPVNSANHRPRRCDSTKDQAIADRSPHRERP